MENIIFYKPCYWKGFFPVLTLLLIFGCSSEQSSIPLACPDTLQKQINLCDENFTEICRYDSFGNISSNYSDTGYKCEKFHCPGQECWFWLVQELPQVTDPGSITKPVYE